VKEVIEIEIEIEIEMVTMIHSVEIKSLKTLLMKSVMIEMMIIVIDVQMHVK